MNSNSTSPAVPVIDLGLTASFAGVAPGPDELAVELERAMQVSGFFYVRNHAISDPQLHIMVDQTKAFFSLPIEQRRAIAIDKNNRGYLAQGQARMSGASFTDLKEVFFFGRDLSPDDPDIRAGVPLCAVNQWPRDIPAFRAAVVAYLNAAAVTGAAILGGFARLMGAPADFFEARYQRPMARGQLIHYPPPDAGDPQNQFGVAPHTDFGCITLLYQHTPGLEVQGRQGQWLSVPPSPGTLVVNIGDLLERWSNGALPSTRHRVRNETGQSRYSVAVFYDPSATAMVDPRDFGVSEPEYSPITASEYILSRSKQVFAQFNDQVERSNQTE